MKKNYGLETHLKRGKVYRRDELAQWSNAIDRHIKELLDAQKLVKVSAGLYLYPKKTVFGKAPADDKSLVTAFLKDNRFIITSPNLYNTLGVGTTQLYNQTIVYNSKRHGKFEIGGRIYEFRRKSWLPSKLTQEFLLVDLVNNIDQLAEDKQKLLMCITEKTLMLNSKKLRDIANCFGTVRTRKFFENLINAPIHYAA